MFGVANNTSIKGINVTHVEFHILMYFVYKHGQPRQPQRSAMMFPNKRKERLRSQSDLP